MIKKFEVEVARKDIYIIEIDDSVIDEKWMEEFRNVFYDFDDLEDHARHIAQVRARFNNGRLDAGDIEGYGVPLLDGRKSPFADDRLIQPAINIRVISEDNNIEIDTNEI